MHKDDTSRREFFRNCTAYGLGAAITGSALGEAQRAYKAHKPIRFSVGTREEHMDTNIVHTPELLHLLKNNEALQQRLDACLCTDPSDLNALKPLADSIRSDVHHGVRPETTEARAAVTDYLVHRALNKAIAKRDGKAIDTLKGAFGNFDALAAQDEFMGFVSDCYRKEAMASGMEAYFPDRTPPGQPFPLRHRGPNRGIDC